VVLTAEKQPANSFSKGLNDVYPGINNKVVRNLPGKKHAFLLSF